MGEAAQTKSMTRGRKSRQKKDANPMHLKPGEEETFELQCTLDDEKMAQIGVDTVKTSEILFTMSAFVKEDEYRFMSERRKRLIERK